MPSNLSPSFFQCSMIGTISPVRSLSVNPSMAVCVERTQLGRIVHSRPVDEMIGSATVREHFPKQEMSLRASMRFWTGIANPFPKAVIRVLTVSNGLL